MKKYEHIHVPRVEKERASLECINESAAKKAKKFHQSFPMYEETPLHSLEGLSKKLKLGSIYVKDESYRFGLNAFKVLGGSYAIGNYIADQLGKDITSLPFAVLTSDEVKKQLGDITFVTATDGNHGRGVAWTANQLRQKSVVYMPKGSSLERLNHIKAEGADASITDLNYDDAVRLANQGAIDNGWIMVQDTAWDGYEKIPTWIMQGYSTMAYEAYLQLKGVKPTHIFIQAGVGSLAGAVIGFFSAMYPGEDRPIMTVVESTEAACLYKTAKANDGKRHYVTGDMNTIMAGLACGEPNTISLELLRDYTDHYISCPDSVAAQGMRVMGNPMENDTKIIAGESGAPGLGLVYEVMTKESLSGLKEELKLDENSIVLCFSSEGDTDKESYRDIVWNGAYPAE